jgi:hypothetical protein
MGLKGRIRVAHFDIWGYVGLHLEKWVEGVRCEREGGSVSHTGSDCGFIYTMFGLSASHMDLWLGL